MIVALKIISYLHYKLRKFTYIIYSIFKKTIGCHALILLNWQY
jgi:hypothetical protein